MFSFYLIEESKLDVFLKSNILSRTTTHPTWTKPPELRTLLTASPEPTASPPTRTGSSSTSSGFRKFRPN